MGVAAPAYREIPDEEIVRRFQLTGETECFAELKIEGYSYEETATHIGLPLEAVKSHLQNGRPMLWMKMERTLSQPR
jgi:DNA-directed RNA polymerase specialized sigma24 family protein